MKKTTTISLDEDLKKEIKIVLDNKGQKFSSLVSILIKDYISKNQNGI